MSGAATDGFRSSSASNIAKQSPTAATHHRLGVLVSGFTAGVAVGRGLYLDTFNPLTQNALISIALLLR